MNKKANEGKSDFVKLFLSTAEDDSINKEAAKSFITSEGLNAEKFVFDGLKRIKQMKMTIEANRTEQEMKAAEGVKQKAIEWVEQLLQNVDFSFTKIVQKEELSISFRNVESLSEEDKKNILIKHFTLKFMKEEHNKNDF